MLTKSAVIEALMLACQCALAVASVADELNRGAAGGAADERIHNICILLLALMKCAAPVMKVVKDRPLPAATQLIRTAAGAGAKAPERSVSPHLLWVVYAGPHGGQYVTRDMAVYFVCAKFRGVMFRQWDAFTRGAGTPGALGGGAAAAAAGTGAASAGAHPSPAGYGAFSSPPQPSNTSGPHTGAATPPAQGVLAGLGMAPTVAPDPTMSPAAGATGVGAAGAAGAAVPTTLGTASATTGDIRPKYQLNRGPYQCNEAMLRQAFGVASAGECTQIVDDWLDQLRKQP